MFLMTEHLESKLDYITEEKNGKKNVMIEGIFMQAESKNRNGRIYPKSIMENAVKKYVTEQVNKGRSVGELNHPDGPTINLDKVSHRITNLEWNGNNVMGKALILDTPMGKIVKGLVEGGVQLGVSSRGMGSIVNRNGTNYVKDDFHLATIDIVQDPSAPDAFVNGIMEGVEWVYENGLLKSHAIEKYEIEIKKTSSNNLAEAKLKVWKDFLSKL
jgi:hypothetical protein